MSKTFLYAQPVDADKNPCASADAVNFSLFHTSDNPALGDTYCGEAPASVDTLAFNMVKANGIFHLDHEFAVKLVEDGVEKMVGPMGYEALSDALMEQIVDDTPDDAPNTDDHPLEYMRSALQRMAEMTAPDVLFLLHVGHSAPDVQSFAWSLGTGPSKVFDAKTDADALRGLLAGLDAPKVHFSRKSDDLRHDFNVGPVGLDVFKMLQIDDPNAQAVIDRIAALTSAPEAVPAL